MANLTAPEFTQAVGLLSQHFGLERLRDKLNRLGAFNSRRGLNSVDALADRIYRMSGGLRLQVAATYAFSSLWGEMLNAKLGEDGEKKLEELAEQVNACLTPKEAVAEGKEEDLDRALGAYREALSASTGPELARVDMLLKAVPAVADRLRTTAPAES